MKGLVEVLDPEVVFRADAKAAAGKATEVRGAGTWARGAVQFAQAARFDEPMLVDGNVGLVFAPQGRLSRVLVFTFEGGKILTVDAVGDPQRLSEFHLSILSGSMTVR